MSGLGLRGGVRRRFGQLFEERIGRDWPTDMEALYEVATVVAEQRQRVRVLDAFGTDGGRGCGRGRWYDHRRHALCLQILVNAVQVWNARYMTASIDHLHTTKPDVVADETALARVAPVTHAHVNSLGRYDLHRQPPRAGHLRPLRVVGDDTDRTVLTPPLGVSGDKY